ncbi:hypothetical protein GYMLUDRAFT_1026179 [Collybiopsis luxurians FD-317 M1]|nr:hypothetical protein GYMLUDRAFT_1026179 [Collybiopsis luxurians FD-317 M1]
MYLAYLSLTHVLEYIIELIMLFVSMIGRIKTLTSASILNCLGELKAFRSSIMVSVPALWVIVLKEIITKLNVSGGSRKSLPYGAMAVKERGVPVLARGSRWGFVKECEEDNGGEGED